MNRSPEVREFLTTRRARTTPKQAGLEESSSHRRVPGLRREEVARLTGVSVDYYSRLERGNLRGVSDSVLDALARALQLTEAERAHLYDLARNAQPRPRSAAAAPPSDLAPTLNWLLDAMHDVPAYLRNSRFDILAINRPGRALFPALVDAAPGEVNLARYIFLDPCARNFYADWNGVARITVNALRIEAGRSPHDDELSALIGVLRTDCHEFDAWWAEHDVALHSVGHKTLRHPVVGDIDLCGQRLDLPAAPGLIMLTYVAEPGSTSAQALAALIAEDERSR